MSAALSSVTNLFNDGPLSPDSYELARGRSILDVVQDDLETLERFDMSRSDRDKLEAWKALLDETGTMLASAQCNAEVAAKLGATMENAAAVGAESEYDFLTTKITDTLDAGDMYSNVAVLAAVCYANPVIFLKYPGSYVFSGLGVAQESASLSHRLNNATTSGQCVTNAHELIATIDDYYARKFTHLVAQLDSIDEGEGKLLDNCAAVWFQEMSDGAAHNLNNLPIVQAGGCGDYFKTGYAVNVEDGSDNLTSGASEAVCADGTPDEITSVTPPVTATPATLANAPINKYFCSLMNALGVKAGADGFPAIGGSAEVTHFGMYDRTEDFIGGGTNPPLISSPGEFVALKANG